ncbi:MAG: siroheme synthase CysG [Pseudomonadota bacterium]
MKSFPAFLDLKGRKVVIVGGGAEALRKARLYVSAGADITMIAPTIEDDVRDELAGRVKIVDASVTRHDFYGAAIAVIADVDDATAEKYAAWARSLGALVNAVDRPSLCDFTTPSIIDRGDITIAISTGGVAPVLGQKLRGKIEALAPNNLGDLAAFAKSFRTAVKASVPADQRRAFWASVFDGPIAAKFVAGDEAGAREDMIAAINKPQAQNRQGVVHIVGAGPGDPELLTLRAHRLLQEADVIVYDKLVSKEIMALARRDADRIFVGKSKADHTMPQEEIGALLVRLAHDGKTVVRLKGGDPFVFGRGGEELDVLRGAGVSAYITPGVTAATGCAAASGMALTHRDYAQALTFVTGHAKGDDEPDFDWASLAALEHTLVIYMGVTKARGIAEKLVSAGRSQATPVAVIENGTRSDQRVLKGRLDGLGALVSDHGVKGPALLVVGEVAALADDALCEATLSSERLSA